MDWSASLLSFLASVTVRSLCLGALAIAAVLVLRVKAPAARHAVFTMTVAGMLLLGVLAPSMPPVAVRVLPVAPEAVVLPDAPPVPDMAVSTVQPAPAPPVRAAISWQQIAGIAYLFVAVGFLARLLFSYLFTVRLVRAARAVDQPWANGVYESAWLSVPITVGWLRPKILLPANWETWGTAKLQAVLAHERTHIARADWSISILAGINRCLFWFNPLAWWLERSLASLAEEACDDAALLQVESEHYAQALLDMAAAVKTGQGRLVWEAMAMAKAAEVRKRIERILDETRQMPRGFTRAGWAALAACSLPLIYVTAVVQLAAQEPPKTPAAMNEYLKGKRQLTPVDVSNMEQYLVGNPHDLEVRSQLIVYYFMNNTRAPRIAHILWLIANHPESNQAAFTSTGISPRGSEFNDVADYMRAAALWRQQTAAKPDDARVLNNAAQFFEQPGGDFEEAERLLLKARSQAFGLMPDRLAKLYASAILGATGDPRFFNSSPKMADRVKTELETSTDTILVYTTGNALVSVARRPTATQPLPPGTLNLNDHPMLLPAIDFGERLLARAKVNGVVTTNGRPVPSPVMLPHGATPTIVGASPEVVARIAAAMAAAPSQPAPAPVRKVDPAYPPLARQARIQSDIRLAVTIGADGSVTGLDVISGHPLLIPSSLEAVRQWTFPTGSTEKFYLIVPFRLDGGNAPLGQPRTIEGVAGGVPGVVGGVVGGVPGGVTQIRGKTEGVPASQRIRVGGFVMEAKLIHKVEPEYPALARQTGIEGTVVLQVVIGEEGTVEDASVVSGHPLLAGAALAAVKQWTYQKTSLNNELVSVVTQVTIPFQLSQ